MPPRPLHKWCQHSGMPAHVARSTFLQPAARMLVVQQSNLQLRVGSAVCHLLQRLKFNPTALPAAAAPWHGAAQSASSAAPPPGLQNRGRPQQCLQQGRSRPVVCTRLCTREPKSRVCQIDSGHPTPKQQPVARPSKTRQVQDRSAHSVVSPRMHVAQLQPTCG